ncbi:ABC transporter related protein [Desulfosarcina cetonica]|uniref:energy-coupling factor ABC transporter ATP-binding protein n=1 Tax=Desulfosarcina cetonica TaxID=90730 RepID=UPI0009F90EAF|nr:energy-coupling factor ABC transporter ATP-binding protein [Desulfosarcina cetonica]VTR69939.1 ABC transporter related protein [Desulfosarcina cetonica]
MRSPIYQIDHLVHRYHGQPVLDIDQLLIQPATIMGLAGPNGSGKSTLLKLMAFIMRPDEGQIYFDGVPALPFGSVVRFQVTLLTQEPYLMKRSVFNNIAYGLRVRGQGEDTAGRIHEALEMVGLDPERFSGRQWSELSGGEAQRVALAARLVLKPRVLLLDEPTASVDAVSSELIRTASLRARQEWGTTLVIASHDREWLYDVCDEVIQLFKGRMTGTGRTNMIFGPWQEGGDGGFHKRLGDGRRLIVPAPPHAEAIAFIDPAAFRILDSPADPVAEHEACIDGTITRLSLERHSGRLYADVRAGSMTLVVCVEAAHVAAMTLHRGWPVRLAYRPERVQWH